MMQDVLVYELLVAQRQQELQRRAERRRLIAEALGPERPLRVSLAQLLRALAARLDRPAEAAPAPTASLTRA